jgi:UV DNA damage endonuclease
MKMSLIPRGTKRIIITRDINIVDIEIDEDKSNITSKIISIEKPIQLGLCCLNMTLRSQKPSIFASRKMIQRTIRENGIEELKRRILLNLSDILKMMEWNDKHGIRVFRLSSELFPHKTNPNIDNYSYDFAKPLLKQIGDLSRHLGQRLTFHPGQYNVVGTPNEEAFLHTLNDLKYHADVLDLMGLDANSVIVVHAGGFYGNKPKTIERWCKNYYRLPENVRSRLVLENCEKSFSIKDCLEVNKQIGIPIVFDTHHFECYKKLHPNETFLTPNKYIPLILETWNKKKIKPKFHISEQGSGKVGHHSDYIDTIPE